MTNSTRLLRWLTPPVRQERDDWTLLRSCADSPELLAADSDALRALRISYRELNQQNQELKIAPQHKALIQLQARVQVILLRCRLYLDARPTHPVTQTQQPILTRILDYLREEQRYLRQQLLLSQTTEHYVKQLKLATQDIWTKTYCSPNLLLNLIRKIKNDDAHLHQPGEFLFASLSDIQESINLQRQDADLSVYLRGLETARLIFFVSRKMTAWQESCELLMIAGLLHDLGWQMLKPQKNVRSDQLKTNQTEIEQGHPVLGAALLGGLRGFPGDSYLTEIISQHHERLDGTGYPRGLHTSALGEYSRRLAVVCRFLELKNIERELTADGIRTYEREEVAFAAALQLFRESRRGEWDETVVDQFLSAVDESLLDVLVETDRHNDPFTLKRFQQQRRDEAHEPIPPPHFSMDSSTTEPANLTENHSES
ncbi:HD-GYP domain-containing protein [Gimesia algae]|uniref:Cyclic di-GMP phosphodiesterase response regulator RpfG n=1 Tax=Gimesia algae TaxID=2527971 RepID=A0A517VM46_9PLAN|nr:HD domain-containing phosphohydrolase [Gimesia algae]QDT93970.1 Cyclic di-GMP phosphodiesterase response regulator RpfG [Gimesia algae]